MADTVWNASWIKKHPSAFLPLAMSLGALGIVLGHAAIYGVVHEADEGAAAHVFQLLMAGQVPVLAYFAIQWLPKSPGGALRILASQIVAAMAALASVFFLT